MKVFKALGITCLISGATALVAHVYNQNKIDNYNREFFREQVLKRYQNTVSDYKPEKYDSLLKANAGYIEWEKAATDIRDSINAAHKAQKAYFDGGKLAADTIKTVKKVIK